MARKLREAATAGVGQMGFALGQVLDETGPGLLEATVARDMWWSLVDGNQVLVWMVWVSSCLLPGCVKLLWLRPH